METSFWGTIAGAIVGLAGIVFGGFQSKRKNQIEQLLAEQKIESEAIKSANIMITTLTEAYKNQAEQITDLRFKLSEIEKEVEECRQDREILVRIVKDNEGIIIREEDRERLGL